MKSPATESSAEARAIELLTVIADNAVAEKVAMATKEIETLEEDMAAHAAAVEHYRKSAGLEGIRPRFAAEQFFLLFDRVVSGGVSDIGRSTFDHRKNFLSNQRVRIESAARDSYVRSNHRKLAEALMVIITERSKGFQKWQEGIAAKIASIDQRLLLKRVSIDEQPRVKGDLVDLENIIEAAQSYHAEAVRLVQRVASGHGSDPAWQTFNDARGQVLGLPTYEVA